MTTARWILALLAVILLGAASVVLVNGHQERKVTQAQQENLKLKGHVHALQEQAGELVAKANESGTRSAQAGAEVLALKAKLARAQSARPGQPANHPVVPGGVPPAGDPPVVVDDLKDQIIEAQDRQIVALGTEVGQLRAALVLKDRALGISEQRARGLEIALEAQQSASRSGRWIGRMQGFVVGLGAGYATGRYR